MPSLSGWLDPWMLDLEPLPITSAPLAGELANSYLQRLAEANSCNLYVLAAHLGQLDSTVRAYSMRRDNWNTGELILNAPAIERLATMTGIPASTLTRTLGAFNIHRRRIPRDDIPTLNWSAIYPAPASTAEISVVRACPRCAAARNITDPVRILRRTEQPACPRHLIWLIDYPAAPLNIAGNADLVAALRHHHNLRRRHPPAELAQAFATARTIWFRYRGNVQPEHYDAIQRRWVNRAAQLSPDADLFWFAVRYPEMVALTSVLISGYWTTAAARPHIREPLRGQRPDFRDFLLETARRIRHPHPAKFVRASSSVGAWAREAHPTRARPRFGYYTPKSGTPRGDAAEKSHIN